MWYKHQCYFFLGQWIIPARRFRLTHIWSNKTRQNWTESSGVPTSCCFLSLSLSLWDVVSSFFYGWLLLSCFQPVVCLLPYFLSKLQHHGRNLFLKFPDCKQPAHWFAVKSLFMWMSLLACNDINTWHSSQNYFNNGIQCFPCVCVCD